LGERAQFLRDFADLDAADLATYSHIFKTYYVPNNAVLLVLGDVKAEEGIRLAKKHLARFRRERRRRSRSQRARTSRGAARQRGGKIRDVTRDGHWIRLKKFFRAVRRAEPDQQRRRTE